MGLRTFDKILTDGQNLRIPIFAKNPVADFLPKFGLEIAVFEPVFRNTAIKSYFIWSFPIIFF